MTVHKVIYIYIYVLLLYRLIDRCAMILLVNIAHTHMYCVYNE